MSLATVTNQRERDKFVEVDGETAVRTVTKESAPTATYKNNSSVSFTYVGGVMTKITQTIDGDSYSKTFTYEDGNVKTISSWESD